MESIKRILPAPLQSLGRTLLRMVRSTRQLAWLHTVAPQLYSKVQRWRRQWTIAWLRSNTPEVYARIIQADVPQAVQENLIAQLALEPYTNLVHRKGWDNPIETELLYVAGGATPDMIKDVIALKRCRPDLHCTLLVLAWGHAKELSKQYFDRIVLCRDHVNMIRWLSSARGEVCIIHHRGLTGRWTPLVRLFWDGRLIFRAYPFHARSRREAVIELGLDEEVNFLGEQYILENVDGIYHLYCATAIDTLRREMNIRCPTVTIRSEVMPELGPFTHLKKLSEEDGQVHLVYAAGLSRRKNGQPLGPKHSDHLDKWRVIVSQGLHLHVYVPHITGEASGDGFEDYFRLARESPHFHIEAALPYDRLLIELTKYDWALYHFDYDLYPHRPEFSEFASNGFYTHVQAGNPIICSPATPLPARLVEEFEIGFAIARDEMQLLRDRLLSVERKNLQKKLERARKALSFDHEALYNLVFNPKAYF